MPRFLLDTSVCVDILRERVSSLGLPPDECCLSSIVAAELWTGLAKSPGPDRSRKLEEFVSLFPVLGFDHAAARQYGEIRAELEQAGTSIGPLDCLIAAHARCIDATLVTSNVKEFRRVKGLRVRAWK